MPAQIFEVGRPLMDGYPSYLGAHPVNQGIDRSALRDYYEHGVLGPGARFDFFVKAKRPFDAVWMSGYGTPYVSARLHAALEPVTAGYLEFRPVYVNGEEFWLTKPSQVIDALDPERSGIRRGPSGVVLTIATPTWVGSRIPDPSLFAIPQLPNTMWATPAVKAAYDDSGCDGMSFLPTGTVI